MRTRHPLLCCLSTLLALALALPSSALGLRESQEDWVREEIRTKLVPPAAAGTEEIPHFLEAVLRVPVWTQLETAQVQGSGHFQQGGPVIARHLWQLIHDAARQPDDDPGPMNALRIVGARVLSDPWAAQMVLEFIIQYPEHDWRANWARRILGQLQEQLRQRRRQRLPLAVADDGREGDAEADGPLIATNADVAPAVVDLFVHILASGAVTVEGRRHPVDYWVLRECAGVAAATTHGRRRLQPLLPAWDADASQRSPAQRAIVEAYSPHVELRDNLGTLARASAAPGRLKNYLVAYQRRGGDSYGGMLVLANWLQAGWKSRKNRGRNLAWVVEAGLGALYGVDSALVVQRLRTMTDQALLTLLTNAKGPRMIPQRAQEVIAAVKTSVAQTSRLPDPDVVWQLFDLPTAGRSVGPQTFAKLLHHLARAGLEEQIQIEGHPFRVLRREGRRTRRGPAQGFVVRGEGVIMPLLGTAQPGTPEGDRVYVFYDSIAELIQEVIYGSARLGIRPALFPVQVREGEEAFGSAMEGLRDRVNQLIGRTVRGASVALMIEDAIRLILDHEFRHLDQWETVPIERVRQTLQKVVEDRRAAGEALEGVEAYLSDDAWVRGVAEEIYMRLSDLIDHVEEARAAGKRLTVDESGPSAIALVHAIRSLGASHIVVEGQQGIAPQALENYLAISIMLEALSGARLTVDGLTEVTLGTLNAWLDRLMSTGSAEAIARELAHQATRVRTTFFGQAAGAEEQALERADQAYRARAELLALLKRQLPPKDDVQDEALQQLEPDALERLHERLRNLGAQLLLQGDVLESLGTNVFRRNERETLDSLVHGEERQLDPDRPPQPWTNKQLRLAHVILATVQTRLTKAPNQEALVALLQAVLGGREPTMRPLRSNTRKLLTTYVSRYTDPDGRGYLTEREEAVAWDILNELFESPKAGLEVGDTQGWPLGALPAFTPSEAVGWAPAFRSALAAQGLLLAEEPRAGAPARLRVEVAGQPVSPEVVVRLWLLGAFDRAAALRGDAGVGLAVALPPLVEAPSPDELTSRRAILDAAQRALAAALAPALGIWGFAEPPDDPDNRWGVVLWMNLRQAIPYTVEAAHQPGQPFAPTPHGETMPEGVRQRRQEWLRTVGFQLLELVQQVTGRRPSFSVLQAVEGRDPSLYWLFMRHYPRSGPGRLSFGMILEDWEAWRAAGGRLTARAAAGAEEAQAVLEAMAEHLRGVPPEADRTRTLAQAADALATLAQQL